MVQHFHRPARLGLRVLITEPWGRTTLSHILSTRGEHQRALDEAEVALRLNPSFALAHTIYGWALLRAGRFEEAVTSTAKALRLSPRDDFRDSVQAYTASRSSVLNGLRRPPLHSEVRVLDA